jgi:bifunctional oligoribonuclease and PAP phosphatase NrnA
MPRPDAIVAAQALLAAPACLIATHVDPEGDAIGSLLALALALEARGITTELYDQDGVPENCRFLPTWERVRTTLPAVIPSLVVFVDADRLERCGLSLDVLPGVQAFVRIDHHPNPDHQEQEVTDREGALPSAHFVDTKAAAAGELVYEVLEAMGTVVTPDMATCLMAALMVDTGRFSYSNVTPRTHSVAAALIAAGARTTEVADNIWGCRPLPALRLLGAALDSLQVSGNGRIAWAVLPASAYEAAGATSEDGEGIIDQVRTVQGTEVAALFSERKGQARVSLRSRGKVDVSAVARHFGGGGHVKAAGITSTLPLTELIPAVLGALDEALWRP